MALVPCKSCGEMISDRATTCPKCGAPVENAAKPMADTSKVDMFIAIHGKELPEFQLPLIREQMLKMDENKMNLVNSLQFKSPTTLLIVSILIGSLGVDRFMLGDTGLGVVKLLTCGGAGIWTIIDWFTVSKRTRELNFRKLQTIM